MRLFRRKKKETPRKSKPASIYYSPAAEEAAVPRTPQERALADFAQESPLETPPTLRTPVQIPSSRNGEPRRRGPARHPRARHHRPRGQAPPRSFAGSPRGRGARRGADAREAPGLLGPRDRRATAGRRDDAWRSLRRAPSTPTTPSKHLGRWPSASTTPETRRRRAGGGGAATSSPRAPSRSPASSPARRRRCRGSRGAAPRCAGRPSPSRPWPRLSRR